MSAPSDPRAITDWSRRFRQLEARKTADADRAAIAPLVTDVDDAGAECVAIGNDWSRRMFDGPFYLSPLGTDGLPATSLVFVRSREGNTVANNPSTLGGGDADKHLIYEGLSRVAADGVLGGAATIAGSHVLSIWRRELVELRASLGLPRHPVQVVATRRGLDLEGGLMFNLPELRVVVITVEQGADAMRGPLAARPWITPVVMKRADGLEDGLRALRQLGIERLSCIGGRTLAGQLIDAKLVQDLYLTTTARSAGEPDTPFYKEPLAGRAIVRKNGTGPDAGVVFEHTIISWSA